MFGFFSKSICISLQKVFPLFQRSQLHVVQCRLSRSSLWKNFGIKRLLVRHFDSQFPPRTLIQKLFEYFTFVTALNITYYPEGSKNITPLELYLLNLLLKEHFQFLFSNFSHADSPSQFQGGSRCFEGKKCDFWCIVPRIWNKRGTASVCRVFRSQSDEIFWLSEKKHQIK